MTEEPKTGKPVKPAADSDEARRQPSAEPVKPAAKPAEPAAKPAEPAAKPAAKPAAELAKPAEAVDETVDREALRREWAAKARLDIVAHDKRVRRFLLRLSLANWGIAVVSWMVSAFLGITSPASIIVYSVLFVIGLVAAILAILTYLLEKFGHEPAMDLPFGGEGGDESDAGDAGSNDSAAASKGDAPAAAAS